MPILSKSGDGFTQTTVISEAPGFDGVILNGAAEAYQSEVHGPYARKTLEGNAILQQAVNQDYDNYRLQVAAIIAKRLAELKEIKEELKNHPVNITKAAVNTAAQPQLDASKRELIGRLFELLKQFDADIIEIQQKVVELADYSKDIKNDQETMQVEFADLTKQLEIQKLVYQQVLQELALINSYEHDDAEDEQLMSQEDEISSFVVNDYADYVEQAPVGPTAVDEYQYEHEVFDETEFVSQPKPIADKEEVNQADKHPDVEAPVTGLTPKLVPAPQKSKVVNELEEADKRPSVINVAPRLVPAQQKPVQNKQTVEERLKNIAGMIFAIEQQQDLIRHNMELNMARSNTVESVLFEINSVLKSMQRGRVTVKSYMMGKFKEDYIKSIDCDKTDEKDDMFYVFSYIKQKEAFERKNEKWLDNPANRRLIEQVAKIITNSY